MHQFVPGGSRLGRGCRRALSMGRGTSTAPSIACSWMCVCPPHPALGALSWSALLLVGGGQLRDLVCAARGPSQAAEQRLTHQSPTMARVLTATGACECEHFVLRAAAQVARVRSQATFLSLRPFIPCRGLLRVAALIVSDCSQQPRLGTKATMQISFRGDLSLCGCVSANKP